MLYSFNHRSTFKCMVYEKWWQMMAIFFHRFAGTLPFITLLTTSSVWMILMQWRNELQNICYLLYLDQFCLIYPNSLKPPTIWKLRRYDGMLFSSCFIFFYLKKVFILQDQVMSKEDKLNLENVSVGLQKGFYTSKSSHVKTR